MKVYVIKTPSEDGFDGVDFSIKIGFPTAQIIYIDNFIKKSHHAIIQSILQPVNDNEPIVLCDPDIIFYSNIQNKLSDLCSAWLMAGRYIPNYYNEVVQANEVKRYHTSLLYFPAPRTLMKFIEGINHHEQNYPFKPFDPFIYYLNGVKFFYDTCANLYNTLPKETLFDFRPDILDCYSHVGCYSILDDVAPKLKQGSRLKYLHKLASERPSELRYLWKEQDIFYKNHLPKL